MTQSLQSDGGNDIYIVVYFGGALFSRTEILQKSISVGDILPYWVLTDRNKYLGLANFSRGQVLFYYVADIP